MTAIPKFGDDPIDSMFSESVVVHLTAQRRLDRTAFESALLVARSDAHRAKVAAEADARSRVRGASRWLEANTAEVITADEMSAICKVMVERRCDVFTAATIVGEQRIAAKAEKHTE